MTDTLHISEFAHGFLLAESYRIFDQVLEAGDISDIDDWQQINDVPLYAGEHCEYADYDLNFWYDEEAEQWHCTAYEIYRDEEGVADTIQSEYRTLW